MAETVDEDSGVGEESINGQYSLSGEALSQWRSSTQVENGTPSTSPSYWDTDDDDDEDYGTCFFLSTVPLCKDLVVAIFRINFFICDWSGRCDSSLNSSFCKVCITSKNRLLPLT